MLSLCAPSFRAHSLASASGFDGAGLVNDGPAKKPRDWRKSLVRISLRLRLDELASVSRSTTLPNEVLQKRGEERAEARDKRQETRDKRSGRRPDGEKMKGKCWKGKFSQEQRRRRTNRAPED